MMESVHDEHVKGAGLHRGALKGQCIFLKWADDSEMRFWKRKKHEMDVLGGEEWKLKRGVQKRDVEEGGQCCGEAQGFVYRNDRLRKEV